MFIVDKSEMEHMLNYMTTDLVNIRLSDSNDSTVMRTCENCAYNERWVIAEQVTRELALNLSTASLTNNNNNNNNYPVPPH